MEAGHVVIAGIWRLRHFDVWQRIFHRMTGIPPSNWAMVGRWLLRLLSGDGLFQNDLAAQPAMPGELRAGWILHYVVAVGYAAVFAMTVQLGWLQADAVDGLVFGIASVAVPWFFFMPALGAGAWRATRRTARRLRDGADDARAVRPFAGARLRRSVRLAPMPGAAKRRQPDAGAFEPAVGGQALARHIA